MRNIKRWAICAILFLICFLILRYLNGQTIIEGHGGGGGHGGGHGGRGGHGGHGGRGYGGHGGRGYGGHGGYGYGGWGGYGGGALAVNPLYIYDDYDDYATPYWYRYIPFYSYYY
jgi:hypothetical protein